MENWELKESLEEHQSALELIMRKYREQVKTLIETNKWEKTIADSNDQSKVTVVFFLVNLCEHSLLILSQTILGFYDP